MMKRFFLILIFLNITCLLAQADSFDDFINLDRAWDGQQTVTNQEFEQVIDKLEEPKKVKEQKQVAKKRKKLFGGGTTLHKELNPEKDIHELSSLDFSKDGILINIPVQILLDNKPLEKGFYKIYGEKDTETGKLFLSFYQSQYYKGKIEVTEMEDDYGEDQIDFAKIIPFNNSFIKLIFGSIDFNAYAIIPYIDD
ncbi:hypothetical protein J6R97_04050 [bacterium]|nr:hypothetical protein [bacterium]